MSVRWMSAVWASSTSTGTARLVLLALADNARDDDGLAWPSVATLAAKTRVDRRTVQRAIACLVEIGELSVQQVHGSSNRYRLCIPRTDVNLTPRQSDTPGDMSLGDGNAPPYPRQRARGTRGTAPPKPSVEPSRTQSEPRRPGAVQL
jgi:Helix-turn-helix domain